MKIAANFFGRFLGMHGTLGKAALQNDDILILVPCSSIHTLCMKTPIDVSFCSREGKVLSSKRNMVPNRFMSCKGSCFTIERKASDKPWFEAGDSVIRYLPMFE